MVSRRLRFPAVLAALAAASLACMTLVPTPPPAPTAIRVPTGGTPRVITSTPLPTLPPSATVLASPSVPAASATRTTRPTESPVATETLPPATATAPPAVTPAGNEPTEAPAVAGSPVSVTGRFHVTNDFVLATYMVEHAVALVDLRGFVLRDKEWAIPTAGQVLGPMRVDLATLSGDYTLSLPAQPQGRANDVDQNGRPDAGVQIFAVAYWPNLAGGPFSEGDDPSFGWPTYLASVQTDSENQDEIIGGKLLVWAPDDQQGFPTGFGPDGLLFTADDPVGPLAAGYSLIDLDQQPFGLVRQTRVAADLYEPKDVAVKDFSQQSYTAAFKSLYDLISTEWAFNGRPEKKVDWAGLYARLAPQVAQAETDQDPAAFFQALFDFTHAIPDGHVGLDGGQYESDAFVKVARAGYGFAVRPVDGGQYLAVFVTPTGPADAAGMKVGAQIQKFNGQPIDQAVAAVTPFSGPFSQSVFLRYQQARYLTRAPEGTEATVTFLNPGAAAPQTVTLQAVVEQASFSYTSFYRNYTAPDVPVEFRILDSGVGYIQIASYYDDLNLIVRLFERALKTFRDSGVTAVIVDLRYNGGGNPLGLAGFLTDQEIPLGQGYRYSAETRRFEVTGPRDKLRPNQTQYHFDQLAVLVGPGCASACETEAYGFSQVPGAMVVGFYSSLGTFADVARGQVDLPEGFHVQFSADRFLNPDGSLYLEGTGVVPTVEVPLTLENITATNDVVLQAAEAALLGRTPEAPAAPSATLPAATPSRTPSPTATPRGGAATRTPTPGPRTPSATPAASGTPGGAGPQLGSPADAEAALQAQARFLEDAARESYDASTLSQAGRTYTYTITLSQDEPLIWMNGWCATTQAVLDENFQHIQITYQLNGQPVEAAQFATFDGPNGDQYCRMQYTVVSNWPAGPTRLENEVTFDRKINDGFGDYPAGTHRYVYIVTRR